MRLLSATCGRSRGESRGRAQGSGVMRLLCVLAAALSCHGCPENCLCSTQTVKCQNKGFRAIPASLPNTTKFLFVTGNNIAHIDSKSFPDQLEQLTDLYLGGNELKSVDAKVFEHLPNLERLDLSNNKILVVNEKAFPDKNQLQILNLSRAFFNGSYFDLFLSVLQSKQLLQLTTLDLSNNDIETLPDQVFQNYTSLVNLTLQNSSMVSIPRSLLKVASLRALNLRNNSLRNLLYSTLEQFNLKPDLQIELGGNPWRCDCFIHDTLLWLKNSTQVLDGPSLTCAEPEALKHRPLLQVELAQLRCSGKMEGVLETSYVFLGLVLALIGVIFLLVLYLNRKGIKRWMYNIRDACRDHMEGYHYRYEINSDPRLANLSINSDV